MNILKMQDLDEFLKTSRVRLQVILNKLQWTEEDVLRENNPNSRTSENKSELLEVDAELTLPPSCADSNSLVLNDEELRKILNNPKAKAAEKFSDLQINFSREEKLLLYEHTVKQREVFEPLALRDNELVSLADIVAMKKREKTKRRKYRIKKPTQTEEVRSLVELQMQALQQYIETKNKMKTNEKSCKKESKKTEYTKSSIRDQMYRKESHTSDRSFQRQHENKKFDDEKSKTLAGSIAYRESRHSEYSKDKSRSYPHKERHRSRSRSRSRHRRQRNRSRSSSRHRSKHHSRKIIKEKRKKSHKSRRHRSRS